MFVSICTLLGEKASLYKNSQSQSIIFHYFAAKGITGMPCLTIQVPISPNDHFIFASIHELLYLFVIQFNPIKVIES